MKTPVQEVIDCYNVAVGLKQQETFLKGLPSVLIALLEKEKEMIIGTYLDLAMKNHGLPMGLEYYSLLERKTMEAEKYYIETFKTK